MSWLNTTLSVPSVGVLIQPNFEVLLNCERLVAPLLQKIFDEYGRVDFERKGALGVTFKSGKGLTYNLLYNNSIDVSYKYEVNQVKKPGELSYSKQQEIRPFTELLDMTLNELLEILKLITKSSASSCARFGVVAEANVDFRAIPPGIESLISYLAEPWGGKSNLPQANVHFVPIIADDENFTTQCHYHISFNGEPTTEEVDIRLDWQKISKKGIPINRDALEKTFKMWQSEALIYFDRVAEGNLNNE
jgi:hypothetical protein